MFWKVNIRLHYMTITLNLYNAIVWKVLFLCKYLIIHLQLDLYTAIDYHQSYGGALFNMLVKDIKPYSLKMPIRSSWHCSLLKARGANLSGNTFNELTYFKFVRSTVQSNCLVYSFVPLSWLFRSYSWILIGYWIDLTKVCEILSGGHAYTLWIRWREVIPKDTRPSLGFLFFRMPKYYKEIVGFLLFSLDDSSK